MVRVGFIEYLNCLPLRLGLEATGGLEGVELIGGPPAQVNAALLSGEVELGLVSSISWARNRERLQVIPGYGIASEGPVMSVILASRRPLKAVQRVALTGESAASQVLARIILERGYKVAPGYGVLSGTVEQALSDYDAVLLIGDKALEARRMSGVEVHDLGELWDRYASLPMVYAVWASRRDPAEYGWFADRVARAVSWAERNVDTAVVEAAKLDAPATADELRTYFGRCIGYRVGASHRKGLNHYLAEARKLIPKTQKKVSA